MNSNHQNYTDIINRLLVIMTPCNLDIITLWLHMFTFHESMGTSDISSSGRGYASSSWHVENFRSPCCTHAPSSFLYSSDRQLSTHVALGACGLPYTAS